MEVIEAVLDRIESGLGPSLDRLTDLLRFPSIGTDPAYDGECRRAAEWLARLLAGSGFETRIEETTGHPLVIACLAPEDLPPHAPSVLFYGHYDVQPPDPLDLWESPPFEPQIRKGRDGNERIFARGAADDKGQLMTFLEATRAWLSVCKRLPFRLTMLLEGDEEGDSTHLERFLAANRRDLKPDIAFICDTGMWDERTPAITTRLRGCIAEEITISGPSKDLHSGYYGGAARNPIRVLTKILSDMHDESGRVAIPGFYEGVDPIPPNTRRLWKSLRFPERQFLRDVGLSIPAGEQGYSVCEQIWARPTAEFNGIWSGYTGVGTKTVLPARASAKLTFRLVGGQDPKRIRAALKRFVRGRLPKDCKASFASQGGDSTGVTVPEDSPWVGAAAAALAREWGRKPILAADGGSIPVVSAFQKYLGIDSLLVGFGREDDCTHSPNEKYDLESFRKGIRSWARIIAEVGWGAEMDKIWTK
jgi:acetylornithine deacetylase/succinyl-diaminopimelate desuccinylase-like protein